MLKAGILYRSNSLILRKSATTALMCRLAGIPQVIGYDKQRFPWGYKRWGWFLHQKARYPSLRTDIPQAESHLSLLTAIGGRISDPKLELWATPDDRACLDAKLSEMGTALSQPIAVFHGASASHGKTLEMHKFAKSLQQLSEAGYAIHCTGTASDYDAYEALGQLANVPIINLAGHTSLRETFALYQRANILLTVDSSPIHIGAAAGIPQIVGVFGPTNERQWGPYNPSVTFHPVFLDLPCRPCYAKVCSHNNCKELLTDLHIADAVTKAIALAGDDVAHLKQRNI